MAVTLHISDYAADSALFLLSASRARYLATWSRPDGHFDGDTEYLLAIDEVIAELTEALRSAKT